MVNTYMVQINRGLAVHSSTKKFYKILANNKSVYKIYFLIMSYIYVFMDLLCGGVVAYKWELTSDNAMLCSLFINLWVLTSYQHIVNDYKIKHNIYHIYAYI